MLKKTLNSITRLLTKEQSEIVSAAAVLMVLLFITKIVGMVYLSLVARQFGASRETDLFYLASLLPEMITNIILLGAISGSVIPIFTGIKENKGKEEFSKSFSSVINLGMLLFVLLSLLAIVFAYDILPLAIALFNPNNSLTTSELETVVSMMRVLLIPQVILGFSAFVSSGLNIYQRFIIPSFAPLFYNIGKIVGVVVLVPLFSGSIWGLVWGTLIGAVLHLLIQIPLWKHLKIGYRVLHLSLTDGSFSRVLRLGLPRTIGLGVEEIARVADSFIAFGLASSATLAAAGGPLTAYQYAVRLIAIPLNLFGTSFAVASFPSLSKHFAKGDKQKFEEIIFSTFQQILFLAIPVSVLLIVLRVPIVRLVYGILGGSFSWENTLQVAWVVLFFSLGISFESLRSTMYRVFYSMHNSLIPLISSVFVVAVGITTGIMFTNYFSHFNRFVLADLVWNPVYFFEKSDGVAAVGGLGLSSSLVFTLEFFFLLIILKKKGAVRSLAPFLKEIAKKISAGLIMFAGSYLMFKFWEELLRTEKTIQLFLLTFFTTITAFSIYFLVSYWWNVREIRIFAQLAKNYLRRFRKFYSNT